MRYVQSIAHMSRFVNQDNSYYAGLLADNQREWNRIVKMAENRAMQVIRYSEEKELADDCHYALAWLYWHTKEYDKGRQHIEALPSINYNMFQETLLPYYISATSEQGMEGWKAQVRDNYQNFIRALNKQIVYAADNMENYTREWIDGKLKFMLGQLKSWSDEAVFAEFEKLI